MVAQRVPREAAVRALSMEVGLVFRAMSTLHLLSGLPCAGKTTYANALKSDSHAVIFTLDVWLITLFGRYDLAEVGHEEHTRRVLACREVTWSAAAALLVRSTDVILDDGFFFRAHREAYVQRAAMLGATTKIHHLWLPLPRLMARIERRNQNLPPFNFRIDPVTLSTFAGIYEPPSESEGAEVVDVRNELTAH